MAANLPRHVLNTFLLLTSQELHMPAQWNFICIYILKRAIHIQNKKYIEIISSGAKGQTFVFIGVLPISLEVIELQPWNLWTMFWPPALMQVRSFVWIWPIGERQLFIVCHTKCQRVVNKIFLLFNLGILIMIISRWSYEFGYII